MDYTHVIVYFSPAGTTRLVAETIRQRLLDHHCRVEIVDLGVRHAAPSQFAFDRAGAPTCLWIGSPVYCDHPVPVVSVWIDTLVQGTAGYAVPFVTWGGVTSGLALAEMAASLAAKRYVPVAAAKVLAVHSSMWRVPEPLAQGHPDHADLDQVRTLVDVVVDRLAQADVAPLEMSRLDYLTPVMRAEAQVKSLAAAKSAMPPLSADQQRCTSCGLCAEICPTRAITLDPQPVIGASCVLCLQCVRSCPEEAFLWNEEAVAARIREMAARSAEEQVTTLFY